MSSSDHMRKSNRNNLNMRRGNYIFKKPLEPIGRKEIQELSRAEKNKAQQRLKNKAKREVYFNKIALVIMLFTIGLLIYFIFLYLGEK